MAQPQEQPKPIKPNAPGVVEFAGYLNSIGERGNDVLRKFNAEAAAGRGESVAQSIQAMADTYGWKGSLWAAQSTAAVTPAVKTPKEKIPTPQEGTGFISELTKSTWNGLLDGLTGAARTPQVLHSAAGGILDAVGYEKSAQEVTDSKNASEALQGLASTVKSFVDTLKVDEDTSGYYDQGLISKDEQGNYRINGPGSAHMIGNSLSFIASMFVSGGITKGARALNGTVKALKAAKAIGDVEKIAELTDKIRKTDNAMRYVTGMMSQLEPTYQEALKATNDPDKAALFAAVVTPVVAAVDAFTGGEAAIFGGKKLISGEIAKRVLAEMAGKELTQEAFGVAAKKVASSILKETGKAAVKVGGEEMLTEIGQEGYTMMVESIFDRASGNNAFSKNSESTDVRLLNAGVLGFGLGGVTGAGVRAMQQVGAYEPLAFRALHDAYKEGGQAAIESQQEKLQSTLTAMVSKGEMGQAEAGSLSEQLNRMQAVVVSMKNTYAAAPKTQWQVYDLNYNHKPELAATDNDLNERLAALDEPNPVRFVTDEFGRIGRNEDGSPQVDTYIDAAAVAMERNAIQDDITDNSRRKVYIDEVINGISGKGNEIDYIRGLSAIGKFDINDVVQGKDDRRQAVNGKIVSISDNGQELTIQTGIDDAGQPLTSVIKAVEAKPYANQFTASVSSAVDPDLQDGFIPHEDINAGSKGYEEGMKVILTDDPSKPVDIVAVNKDTDGSTVLTVDMGDGTTKPVKVDAAGTNILGAYDPVMAITNADTRSQQNESSGKREQLEKKLPKNITAALKAMSPQALAERWMGLEGVAGKETERNYIDALAAERGIDVRNAVTQATEDVPAQTDTAEVIDDATWESIGMDGIVPDSIVNDIAGRLLSGEQLSGRQTEIMLDNDEAVRIGAIMDSMAIELLQQNETISQGETPAGSTAASADQGAGQQDASAADAANQSADVQQPVQSAQPVLAEQSGNVAGGTGTDSSTVGETTQPGAQQSTDGNAGITERVSDEMRDKMIKGLVSGAEYDMNLFRLWPDQVASGIALTPNQQAVLDAASPSEQARYAAALATARQSAIRTEVAGSPVAQVGQDVKVTLNSGTQTIGRIVSFEAGDAWVEHDDRRGRGKTMSRVGEGQIIDKATGESLSIPKEQRASSMEQLTKEALGKLIVRLRKSFPKIEVAMLTDQEMQDLVGTSAYGAVKDGVVYINMDSARADTPIHEFAHLYADALKKHYPNIYNRGIGLVKGSAYEQAVQENYPELTSEEDILEEALAQAIGERGARIETPSKLKQFIQWVKNILTKIGEAIGVNLTSESTLDDFIDARAKELLSGQTLAELTPDAEGTRLARKVVLPPLPALQPVMDESALGSFALDEKQRKELAAMDIVWDEASDSYSRQTVDSVAEGNTIASTLTRIMDSNALTKTLARHMNTLDVANVGRVLFGDSAFGQKWQGILEAGRRRISPMKIAAHDFTRQAYDALAGRTLYRGMTSPESVDKWTIDAELNGQPAQVQITPDVAMSIAGQYRSMLADYGHFDPKHREKRAAGQEPQMEVMTVDLTDPSKQIVIKLNDAQLRDLSDMVFYQDQATANLMTEFELHTDAVFDPVSRTYTIMNSGQLPKSNWYYPISSASTEAKLNQRDIQRFVDDASQLRAREGAPARIVAYGFLSDINRYHHDAETYVQFAPLWQNIDKLIARQEGNLINMDMKHVVDSLNKLRDAFATPDANSDSRKFSGWFNIDIGKWQRLATLSRFAFNLAIPVKQVTGYFSAYGSGAIDSKYLTQELGNYTKMIGESYALIGRGSQEGNYTGGTTSFDEGISELRSIDDPAAQNLLWRVLGNGNPDIQFDNFSSIKDLASGRALIAGKMQAFFEEYGLAATHRADVAVVMALYNAAKRQVAETNGSLPYDEQQKMAAKLAKEALYYSNSTYDRTDRAGIQLNANIITQMLLLYKSHNMKIYNTLARRSIEYGLVDPADQAAKAEAKGKMLTSMGINAVLAPVVTTMIDFAIKGIRDITKGDKEKEDFDIEKTAKQLAFNALSQVAQVLPAELGDIGGYTMSKLANPNSPREVFDINPFGVIADVLESGVRLALVYKTEYKAQEQFEENRTRALQQVLRTVSTITGTPMELVRQLNNVLADWMLPDKKQSRSRSRSTGGGDLGIEYELGIAEPSGRRR